jgi:cyclophilin family peptidyl-prolyl cis-trans isomerase/HEAT repeat protein
MFLDTVYREIYEYQYLKDATGLNKYLDKHHFSDPNYLTYSAQAYANIGDTTALPVLKLFLADQDSLLRARAAYAFGFINDTASEKILRNAFKKEENEYIQAVILESTGKIGDSEDEQFISSLHYKADKPVLLTGQMKALAKLAERGFSSYTLLPRIVGLLQTDNVSDSTKYWASYYLYRAKIEVNDFEKDLINIFNENSNFYIKNNIVRSMQYTKSELLRNFSAKTVANPETDYRLIISALRGLTLYEFEDTKSAVMPLLESDNEHKTLAAAEYFYQKADEGFADTLFRKAQSPNHFKTSALLFAGALRHSENKEKISNAIRKRYNETANVYEKSALLEALKEDARNYAFIRDEMSASDSPIIQYTALSCLNDIRLSADFESLAGELAASQKKDLEQEFADIYKKALLSGDIARVATAADMLYNPVFNAREIYENTYFVKQAISNCNLPADTEAMQKLLKLDAYLNGSQTSIELPQNYYYPINWESITSISPQQQVRIHTDKGAIDIQLHVNRAPQTVSRFTELVKTGYYDDKTVHRAAAGFVIQSGCMRGDGWGSLSQLLRTEIAPGTFNEGSVGLASAGTDTESAQWFITLDRTPHLDGKYTLFGTVVKGMEVAHRIQAGDKIKKMELL